MVSPKILGLFAVSAMAPVIFAFVERSAGNNSLVPRQIFTNGAFVAAGLATLLMSANFFAALLFVDGRQSPGKGSVS